MFDSYSSPQIYGLPSSSWPSERQLAKVGSAIATWSWLDLAFETLLCTLTQTDHMLCQALTETLSPDNRLKAAKRLIDAWETVVPNLSEDNLDALQKARSNISWIASNKHKRNNLAHRIPLRSNDETIFFHKHSIKPAFGKDSSSDSMANNEIDDFIFQAATTANSLFECDKALQSLPIWPAASRDVMPIPGLESLLGPYLRRGR